MMIKYHHFPIPRNLRIITQFASTELLLRIVNYKCHCFSKTVAFIITKIRVNQQLDLILPLLTLILLGSFISIFNHLRLCLAIAIHSFKYSYLFILGTNILTSCCLDTYFIPKFGRLIKQIKNDNSRPQQDEGSAHA